MSTDDDDPSCLDNESVVDLLEHSRTYLTNRDAFRERAMQAFSEQHPTGEVVLEAAGELVAAHTLFLSNRDLRALPHGPHIGSLIVSYCRTHFIAADLVRQSELIEASVLIRKQMELLARLRELEETAFANPEGKVPNVRHLRTQARKLYGDYSAIAHSSKDEPLWLLGRRGSERGWFATLYPECDHNAFAAAHTLGLLALDFTMYAREFCAAAAAGIAGPDTEIAFQVLLQRLSD